MILENNEAVKEVKVLNGGREIEYSYKPVLQDEKITVGVSINGKFNLANDYTLFSAMPYYYDEKGEKVFISGDSKKVTFITTTIPITSFENLPIHLAIISYNAIEKAKNIIGESSSILDIEAFDILQEFIFEKMEKKEPKFEVNEVSNHIARIEIADEQLLMCINKLNPDNKTNMISLFKYGEEIKMISSRYGIYVRGITDVSEQSMKETIKICNYLRENTTATSRAFNISKDEALEILNSFIYYILQPVNQ